MRYLVTSDGRKWSSHKTMALAEKELAKLQEQKNNGGRLWGKPIGKLEILLK